MESVLGYFYTCSSALAVAPMHLHSEFIVEGYKIVGKLFESWDLVPRSKGVRALSFQQAEEVVLEVRESKTD